MMLQCDYTVSLRNPGRKAHVEDGLVLADAALQEEIASIAPTCFQRIQARQRFLRESLHIRLPEEVLPLSDLSCVCFPYMADTSVLLVKED